MISRILKDLEFPVESLLQELDKNQLLFLHFYLNGGYKKIIGNNGINLNEFEKDLLALGFNKIMMSKPDLIKNIRSLIDNQLDLVILYSLYCNNFSNPLMHIGSIFLSGIDMVSTSIFSNKSDMFLVTLSNNDNLKIITEKSESEAVNIIDNYCIKGKTYLNVLGLVDLLRIIELILHEMYEKNSNSNESVSLDVLFLYEKVAVSKFFQYYKELLSQQKKNSSIILNNLSSKIVALEKEKESQNNYFQKLNDSIKKLNEEKKNQQLRINDLQRKNSSDDSVVIKKLVSSNDSKDTQILKLTNDLKNIKEKPSGMYTQMIDNLNNQIIDLKSLLRDKNSEVKDLNKRLNEVNSVDPKKYIEQYLKDNDMSESLFNIISPYYESYINNNQSEKENTINQEEKPTVPIGYDKIGYCMIEENIHYIAFPNRNKFEIKDIPESIYIGENQFILVNNEYRFKWAYPYVYEKSEYNLYKFGCVKLKNNNYYITGGNIPTEKVYNIPSSVYLKDDCMVAVDNRFNFVRYYKYMIYNASSIFKSAKARGHKLLFIIKVFPNGIFARDIETDEEFFKPMDMTNSDIKEQQSLIMNNDEILNTFKSYKFYTDSKMYHKSQCGTIDINDNNIFIKKLSGETTIVNNIPEHIQLELGQVVNVDEFNNFLSITEIPENVSKETPKKYLSGPKNNSINDTPIEITKSVTILGNISYENSYKLTMLKGGYKVEVIDGCDPWNKIVPYLKNVDVVVVCTENISHDNMWRIKDNIIDIPIIYAKYNGANRILEELTSLELKYNKIDS